MLRVIQSSSIQVTSGHKQSYFVRTDPPYEPHKALAFHHLPLAVLVIDENQTILSANIEAQLLLCRGQTMVTGLPLRQFMDVPMGCRLGEILLTRADLSSSLVEITITPFESITEHGIAQTFWSVMIRDISGLAQATQELTEHRLRLLQALTAADMGIWDWDPKRNQIDRTARTWEIVRGLPKGSLRDAQAPSITLECMIDAVVPEHRQWLKQALMTTFEKGIPGELEVKAQATSQREVWLQIWMVAYRNARGQIQGIRGLVTDISHRKHISEENRRLKEHFHRIIELSPLATLIIERKIITLANRAALSLWGLKQLSEMMGRSVDDFFSPDDLHTLQSLHEHAIAHGIANHTAMQVHRIDGTIRDIEASASHISGHEVDSLQLVLYDTTETRITLRLLQEAQLEAQRLSAISLSAREEERRHIARELHDELGQRLSVLKIRIHDLLKQSSAVSSLSADFFQNLLEELLDDANDMMRALRSIASHLRPTMLDDLGLAAAIEWLAKSHAQYLTIDIQTHCAQGLDDLGDPIRITIYRLVQEALTNVGKHAKASKAMITVTWDEDTLVASIQDDGVGVTKAQIRSDQPSWGLIGLKERASQLGGMLLANENPQGGYLVTMRIPQARPK